VIQFHRSLETRCVPDIDSEGRVEPEGWRAARRSCERSGRSGVTERFPFTTSFILGSDIRRHSAAFCCVLPEDCGTPPRRPREGETR